MRSVYVPVDSLEWRVTFDPCGRLNCRDWVVVASPRDRKMRCCLNDLSGVDKRPESDDHASGPSAGRLWRGFVNIRACRVLPAILTIRGVWRAIIAGLSGAKPRDNVETLRRYGNRCTLIQKEKKTNIRTPSNPTMVVVIHKELESSKKSIEG